MRIVLHILSFATITFLIIFVLLASQPAYPSQIKDQEIVDYKKAWKFIESGDIEKARDLVKKNYDEDVADSNAFNLFWLVPQSVIYLDKKNYEKALYSINKARPKIERLYYALKTDLREQVEIDPPPEKGREYIVFNYKKILLVSSTANFKLQNWMEALNDYLEQTKEFNDKNYYLKAVCFYQIKNYPEALINFQYAYKFKQSEELKDEIAYNIACLYSILDDVDQSISWLKIPLNHNINKWFPKIAEEKNFDNIRNNPKFKNFLKQEKKKLRKEGSSPN